MSIAIFTEDQLRRRDLDTLKRFLRIRLGGYRVAIMDIRTDNVLYRGVQWRERPTRVEQVSYPPPDKARIGRANRAGSPMLLRDGLGHIYDFH